MADSMMIRSDGHDSIAGRADVVFRKGRYRLVNQTLSPDQAMVDDLLAIRAVLESSGIEYLLIRGERDRPVIAVDVRRRAELEAAFAAAFADEPFYAKSTDHARSSTVLLADGALSHFRGSAVFQVFRPRVGPGGALAFGAAVAPQIELWRFEPEEIVAPRHNALMRRRVPRSDTVEETIERYGVAWPTLEGMFEQHASDIMFDIDLVFSWVDGSDAEFQRARAERMASYVVGEGDDSEARYRQIDELKFALRSVSLFAPWVRRIFIATDSPRPAWLADHPKVTLVRSEEMFPDLSVLPTHNSHAVEAQLHRIPGLSEHFLYSNDDMFFGRPVSPDMFFSPGGITKFIEADLRIGLGTNHPARSGYENAARNNRRLLQDRFGSITTRHLEHAPTPLRKSVMEELEQAFPEDFSRTVASRFRSATDISVTNSLYHYYALMTGRAVTQENADFLYVETTLKSAQAAMNRLLKRRSLDLFCLNDGSFPEISVEERTSAVRSFLERYFPIPAPWEVPEDLRSEPGSASSWAAREQPAN
jgi:hypothetical protein